MKTLLINTPEQNDYNNPTVELKEKNLKKWLAEQPILNLVRSVPVLLDKIQGLNEEPIANTLRLKLLELYYEQITAIFYSFDDIRLQQAPIEKEQKMQVRLGIGTLCTELSNGYKIIVKDALRQHKKNMHKNKLATLSCFRAIECLSLSLMHAYRTYAVPPPFNLLELHQLYKFAEFFQIDGLTFSARNCEDKPAIRHLYVRTILLTISDPFRLPVGGLIKMNDYLFPYAPECKILPFQNKQDGAFILDLDSDAMPTPGLRLPENLEDFTDSAPEDLRVLDVTPLIHHVNTQLSKAPGEYDKERLLLEILLPKLQVVQQRRAAKRIPVEKQAYIATGSKAIRFFLKNTSDHIHLTETTERPSERNYGIQIDSEDDAEERPPEYSLNRWQVKNEALRGYLMQCQQHCELLGVGQLLAVAQTISTPRSIPFTLSIIRWLRAGHGTSVEVGVETIPGIPVIGTITNAENATGNIDCILLPAIPALKTPPSLMVDKGLVQQGEYLHVTLAHQTLDIQITHAFEDSTYFDAFHYIDSQA